MNFFKLYIFIFYGFRKFFNLYIFYFFISKVKPQDQILESFDDELLPYTRVEINLHIESIET